MRVLLGVMVLGALACDAPAALHAPALLAAEVTARTAVVTRWPDPVAEQRVGALVGRFSAWRKLEGPAKARDEEARAIDRASRDVEPVALSSDGRTRLELVRFHVSLAVARLQSSGHKRPYRLAVRGHCSLDATPEELRDAGLEELGHIEAEIAPLAARLGHAGDTSTVMAALRKAPRPARDMLATVEATQLRAIAALPRAFAWTEVKASDIHRHAGDWAPPGWYVPATGKNRRGPGFYLAVGRTRLRPMEMEVLSIHETVPGHHYQHEAARAAGRDSESFGPITAFTEGWATYAERVADELGVFSGDEARLGMLCFQAWRASRVVVDTGLHAFGWSRDQARAFFREHTALSDAVIEHEIGRSRRDPAHGLGYTVGARTFRRLREEASMALGAGLDLPELHRVMLEWGDVPLATLERRVREWIDARRLDPT